MDDGREGMSLEVSMVKVTPGGEDSSYREPQASMLRAATRPSVGEQETRTAKKTSGRLCSLVRTWVLPSVVVHTCHPSTAWAEAGRSPFKAILGYKARPWLKNKKRRTGQ